MKNKVIDSWQNVTGAAIPDWVQGRGTGQSGRNLYLMTGFADEHITVINSEYVLLLGDNKIVSISEDLFTKIFEKK